MWESDRLVREIVLLTLDIVLLATNGHSFPPFPRKCCVCRESHVMLWLCCVVECVLLELCCGCVVLCVVVVLWMCCGCVFGVRA